MIGMTTCEKCRKKIKGKMIYAGGAVWHPKCYPYKKISKSKKSKRK
jgi:hypothetical protein